ncbi:MAG TPA: choice-of-anchor X domain-containing protein [Thermoanaerobaculia bacterium]|nr:choice-of-anchor X domain-containing protein [Thermoanaerobaculia bacterium]
MLLSTPRPRIALLPALLLVLATGCGGGSSPTSPATGQSFEMTTAQVVVDGQVLNGATVPMHQGGATRFEARLEADGLPARGGTVYCRYDRPGGGMGGMHRQGVFTMYDDGTHGDHTPGDGLYCLEDDRGEYGCHGDSAGPGEYRYEFWGEHPAHGQTAHHQVTVTVR